MAARSKVETATEADWSFMADPEWVERADKAARSVHWSYRGSCLDDLKQDAYVYLSVSADLIEKYRGNEAFMFRRICHYLTEREKLKARDAKRLVPFNEEMGLA